MKQTIEIEVPDGKKAVWKDGKVVFEDIKPQLPKTWKEFCKNFPVSRDECYMRYNSNIVDSCPRKRDYKEDKVLLPSYKSATQHLVLIQLHQLRDCYRQGWIPDCSNNSKKWCILKYNNDLLIDIHYNRIEFLSFQTREIAKEFLNNFRDLIEQAEDLI